MCKIGILGGTFNPIHNGHIEIARRAKEQYMLDEVIFLTSGNPPHKRDVQILDAKIRHIMVKRAVAGIDGFSACDWEVNREEYSYTKDALRHFKELYPNGSLYFIIGGDSLRDFNSWKSPQEILKLCTLLVYDRKGGTAKSDFAKTILGDAIDISSSEIRENIKNGSFTGEGLPQVVWEFIKRNNIYKCVPDFEVKLKTMLTPKRFLHSIGVRDTAVHLAKINGADEKKAEIAGLLHDNAKHMDNLYERCRDLEVELDEFELKTPALVHAKLGAETAKCEFGISDPEIISAIRWHTIGRPCMTLLEKIVFVADLIEPNRKFPDIAEIREVAEKNIDEALLKCVEATIKVNKIRGFPIHPNAYEIILKKN